MKKKSIRILLSTILISILLMAQSIMAFAATPIPDGSYYIKNVGTGKYLTCNYTSGFGANASLSSYTGGTAQKFKVTNYYDSWFRRDIMFINPLGNTNLALEVEGGRGYPQEGSYSGFVIDQAHENSELIPIKNANGTYRIVWSYNTNLALAVIPGSDIVRLYNYTSLLNYFDWQFVVN